MRNKAYRYHQNKTHNDRYTRHKGNRQFMTNNKGIWNRYSKNITWNRHDSKQMEDLKQQIEEHNEEATHKIDGKKLPKYRTYE